MTCEPVPLVQTPLGGDMSAQKVGAPGGERARGRSTVRVSPSPQNYTTAYISKRRISFSENKKAVPNQPRVAASASHRIKNLNLSIFL